MANVAAYAAKASLDWLLGGAAVTQPTKWGVGLALGAPASTSGSEMTTGVGYVRQTMSFSAATSPAGSAVNAIAATYGPLSNGGVIVGLQIWDTVLSLNSGNMLWYGTLQTARTFLAGDYVIINSGALTISLA